MLRPRGVRRRERLWGALAAVALCWPGRLAGPFDGLPLDTTTDAIGIGLLFPALWWFMPAFLGSRFAQVVILLLVVLKATAAIAVSRDGWCVAFDTPAPIVKNSTGRPHSWDVRADWTSPDPRCSAIMTRAYVHTLDLPAFFLNLSPADDNPPRPEDRPPLMVFRMRVRGFLHARDTGEFAVETTAAMTTTLRVDEIEVAAGPALAKSTSLSPGRHAIDIDAIVTGNQWRFRPTWNGIPLGRAGFPVATDTPPSTLDLVVRPAANAVSSFLAAALLLAWLVTWIRWIGDAVMITIGGAACLGLVAVARQPLTPSSTWAITALALMAWLNVPARLRNCSGLFLLVGAPWLTFVAATHADTIGRFRVLDAGNDWWTFQRFAYRIYLQGYWLEGGQPTFWFQPLYRWIAGALHLVFGDSHFGEFLWDGACVLAVAMLAYYVARLSVGFRAGILAAVLTLTMVMRGPGFSFVGRGLSEWSAAGFLCLAAQFALRDRLKRFAWRPGVLAVLGVYTRLNHLPMAAGVTAFALRMRLRTRDLVHPRRVMRSVAGGVVAGTSLALLIGLLLFAARTWYYTGVYSVTHGTSFGTLALSEGGASLAVRAGRMADSLAMLLAMTDPPIYTHVALPLMIAGGASLAALLGVPLLRDLPAPAVLFFLSACAGSLVARGSAYPGRFSLHLVGIASALTVCTVALIWRAAGIPRRWRQRQTEARVHDAS